MTTNREYFNKVKTDINNLIKIRDVLLKNNTIYTNSEDIKRLSESIDNAIDAIIKAFSYMYRNCFTLEDVCCIIQNQDNKLFYNNTSNTGYAYYELSLIDCYLTKNNLWDKFLINKGMN